MMDDRFFAYYEDFDYSIRSLDAGFRNVVDWSSSIYHVDKSMTKRPHEIKPHYWYYIARNDRRLWRKHLGPIRNLRIGWWGTNRFIRYMNQCKGDLVAREARLLSLASGMDGSTRPAPTLLTFARLGYLHSWSESMPSAPRCKGPQNLSGFEICIVTGRVCAEACAPATGPSGAPAFWPLICHRALRARRLLRHRRLARHLPRRVLRRELRRVP